MGDSVKSCGALKENEYDKKSRICCHERVTCDFYKSCFCAVKWMKTRLKLKRSLLVG